MEELIYYGWRIWGDVARIMSKILNFFNSGVGNFGIAIIMLTLLVRACMFPLSKKQALNMIKMQELQPQMKAITEKYKNDMEKRAKAQQELIRKNNYNPMGGCLLMFVQLPIFLGLYRSLMVDIELRDAPLFGEAIRWCSNLGRARHAVQLVVVHARVHHGLPRPLLQSIADRDRLLVLVAAEDVHAAPG